MLKQSVGILITVLITTHALAAPSGVTGRYRVLPCESGMGQPFDVVDFTYAPALAGDRRAGVHWQMTIYAEKEADGPPLMILRAATATDPLADRSVPLEFLSYQLAIPATEEKYDYRDANRPGRPLVPMWGDFSRYFVPRPLKATGYRDGLAHSAELLGNAMTLRETRRSEEWKDWDNVKVLELDREMWIGTGRTVKDRQGKRIPQKPERRNYDFVQWTREDYEAMIEAGHNLFSVVPGMGPYVRSQPVFYRGGAAGVSYPADLYRTNFVGPLMYMDEPACRMVGNSVVNTTLKYFTDVPGVLGKRVASHYLRHMFEVEDGLRERGISFADMRLAQLDYATWETRYETTFYQLEAGAAGFVHEGRYQLDEFNEFAKASTGLDRAFTAEEMFRYYYAMMRGPARHFGKDWGTSIYGQADPELSPLAVKLAYDMGARYIWFWTSDHDHHMPFPEQLELARIVRQHAAEHPRGSIRPDGPVWRSVETGGRLRCAGECPKPMLDKVIVVPYGYFLVLESPTGRKNPWDLWWVREMDAAGRNESSQRYRRLMRNALIEVHKALDAGEDFDITIDDGTEITGYREIVRLRAD